MADLSVSAAGSIYSLNLELNPLDANIHFFQNILAGNHTLPLNIWPQMLSETVGKDYDPLNPVSFMPPNLLPYICMALSSLLSG